MSDSVQPHRQQPIRLHRPWDSPGKNTGVGCHFLLQCMKMKSQREVAQSCPTLSDPMDCSLPGSSVHGIFQARVLRSALNLWKTNGRNRVPKYTLSFSLQFSLLLASCTSVVCLLQSRSQCAQSLQLCPTLCDPHPARVLERVAMPSSRGSP